MTEPSFREAVGGAAEHLRQALLNGREPASLRSELLDEGLDAGLVNELFDNLRPALIEELGRSAFHRRAAGGLLLVVAAPLGWYALGLPEPGLAYALSVIGTLLGVVMFQRGGRDASEACRIASLEW